MEDVLVWYVAGPVFGLLVVALYAVSNQRLGVSGSYLHLGFTLGGRPAEAWRLWFLGGLFAGTGLRSRAVAVVPRTSRLAHPTRRDAEDRAGDPEAKHVADGFTFGIGWAVAGNCPGAVAAMVVGGRLHGLWVMPGIAAGVVLRDRREKRTPAAAPVRPQPTVAPHAP